MSLHFHFLHGFGDQFRVVRAGVPHPARQTMLTTLLLRVQAFSHKDGNAALLAVLDVTTPDRAAVATTETASSQHRDTGTFAALLALGIETERPVLFAA